MCILLITVKPPAEHNWQPCRSKDYAKIDGRHNPRQVYFPAGFVGVIASPFVIEFALSGEGLAPALPELSSPRAVPVADEDDPLIPDASLELPAPLLVALSLDPVDELLPAVSAFDASGRNASPCVALLAPSTLLRLVPWLAELSRPAAPPAVPVLLPDALPLAPLDVLSLAPLDVLPLAPLDVLPLAPLLVAPDDSVGRIASPFIARFASSTLLTEEDGLAELSRPFAPPSVEEPLALCAWATPKAIRSALVNAAVLNLFMKDSFVVE